MSTNKTYIKLLFVLNIMNIYIDKMNVVFC